MNFSFLIFILVTLIMVSNVDCFGSQTAGPMWHGKREHKEVMDRLANILNAVKDIQGTVKKDARAALKEEIQDFVEQTLAKKKVSA